MMSVFVGTGHPCSVKNSPRTFITLISVCSSTANVSVSTGFFDTWLPHRPVPPFAMPSCSGMQCRVRVTRLERRARVRVSTVYVHSCKRARTYTFVRACARVRAPSKTRQRARARTHACAYIRACVRTCVRACVRLCACVRACAYVPCVRVRALVRISTIVHAARLAAQAACRSPARI
eukprot:6206312-Pleurochrysis_carterae.AAC.3